MIKLIASDVDGTLVKDSSPEIDPEYIPLLREVADQGIYFAVASGRQYGSIRKMFEEVERNLIYIAENGAHIVMGGKTVSMVEMNRGYVEEIIWDLRKFYNQDCHIVASTTDGCLLESKDEQFIELMREGYRNDVRFTSDILKENEPIIKVSLYRSKDIRSIGESVLIPKWKNRVKSCMAGEEWVDFMDFSVDKGKALRYVQNKLGILTRGIFRDLITVISCYKNLVKPLKTLKFSRVSSPSHLVSCYIVLPLVMTSDKGKNKGKKIW